jgi:hypothetical protein
VPPNSEILSIMVRYIFTFFIKFALKLFVRNKSFKNGHQLVQREVGEDVVLAVQVEIAFRTPWALVQTPVTNQFQSGFNAIIFENFSVQNIGDFD